jgi:hypothetical protein
MGLKYKYNSKFDISKLSKQFDQIALAGAHWTFTSPVVMILITMAIFLIGALTWNNCFQNLEPPATVLLAPLMPMPIINPRPINKVTKSNPISISISY